MSSNQKLMSALYKLAQENFSVTDDTILDKLYFHIVNSPSFKDKESSLVLQLSDWLDIIIQGWNNKVLFYGVRIFSVRFIGNIGSDKVGFKMLQDHNNVLSFLEHLISSSDVQNDGCLMVSLVNTLELVSKHEEGCQWVTESRIWRPVLDISYENEHIYTKRAVIQFISQTLMTSSRYGMIVGNAIEIVSYICEPLVSSHLIEPGTSGGLIVDDEYDDYIEPAGGVDLCPQPQGYETGITISNELLNAAKYLCDIVEIMLGNKYDFGYPVKLSLVNTASSGMIRRESVIAKNILDRCSSSQDHVTFSSLLLMVEVSNVLRQETLSCTFYAVCCLKQFYFQIHRIMKSLTLVGHLRAIPNFCVKCLNWLSKIQKKKANYDVGCPNCGYIESTIIYCLRLFLISHNQFLMNRLTLKFKDFSIGEYLSKQVVKECISNVGQGQKNRFQFIQLALSALSKSYELIVCHDNLVALLGTMLETFHSLVDQFLEGEVLAKPMVLQLLDIISKMVQKDRFTFQEILDVLVCGEPTIIHSIFRLIGSETDDMRVIIISLQALKKFLNFHILTELMDKDSSLPKECLKTLCFCNHPVLGEKLTSQHWEVRDTVIELFQTALEMTELTPWFFDKTFPPSLLKLIYEKASDDESSYVKASALNFFCTAVRCKFFADVILPNSLLNLALKTLLEENMPVARKSACDLISALYISYIPNTLSDTEEIFETVYLACTKDLDWEVKNSTLRFWQCTIDKYLLVELAAFRKVSPPSAKQEAVVLENMFRFPKKKVLELVTFRNVLPPPASKETVARIVKVLETLGESGCLKALWLSLNDDCDLKVSQEAQSIVESLVQLNERWGFVEDVLKYQEDGKENGSIESFSRRLTPKRFFSLLQNENWREKIDSHQKWIENTCDNLPSLLDHILDDNRMDDCDHNAVDCY